MSVKYKTHPEPPWWWRCLRIYHHSSVPTISITSGTEKQVATQEDSGALLLSVCSRLMLESNISVYFPLHTNWSKGHSDYCNDKPFLETPCSRISAKSFLTLEFSLHSVFSENALRVSSKGPKRWLRSEEQMRLIQRTHVWFSAPLLLAASSQMPVIPNQRDWCLWPPHRPAFTCSYPHAYTELLKFYVPL